MYKEILTCHFIYYPEFFSACRVSSCKPIKNKYFPVLQIGNKFSINKIKFFLFNRHVVSEVLDDRPLARRLHIGHVLHPSPASPAANRSWDEVVDRQMQEYGLLPVST